MGKFRFGKAAIHRLGRMYVHKLCRDEHHRQTYSHHNERPIEYGFALRVLAEQQPRTVLDVGTGNTAWPHLLRTCGMVVRAIDNVRDYWPDGMINRHWFVEDVDIVGPCSQLGRFDGITCISVLEHIVDHKAAVANMANLLVPNGILILTTPYSEHHPYPNVYDHPEALYGKDQPYICRSSARGDLDAWLAVGLKLESRELWKMFTGDVWATGQRTKWERTQDDSPHQLGCFLFRKR